MFAQHAVTPEALAARIIQFFLENLPGVGSGPRPLLGGTPQILRDRRCARPLDSQKPPTSDSQVDSFHRFLALPHQFNAGGVAHTRGSDGRGGSGSHEPGAADVTAPSEEAG